MSAAVQERRERLARAMYEATEWSGCDGASWDNLVAPYPQRLRRWHELADAVIAVDEPVIAQLQAKVALLEFNLRTPVGTTVRFWPGVREGEGRTSRTASTAWLLGETPVALVEDYSGGVSLSHIEVVR